MQASPNITAISLLFPNLTDSEICHHHHLNPKPEALKILRGPRDPDLPWPGFLLGQTPASIWYFTMYYVWRRKSNQAFLLEPVSTVALHFVQATSKLLVKTNINHLSPELSLDLWSHLLNKTRSELNTNINMLTKACNRQPNFMEICNATSQPTNIAVSQVCLKMSLA